MLFSRIKVIAEALEWKYRNILRIGEYRKCKLLGDDYITDDVAKYVAEQGGSLGVAFSCS
jgi:hypothetical protein